MEHPVSESSAPVVEAPRPYTCCRMGGWTGTGTALSVTACFIDTSRGASEEIQMPSTARLDQMNNNDIMIISVYDTQ